VGPSVVEVDARACDQVLDGAGYKHLAWTRVASTGSSSGVGLAPVRNS
jgi:hypothetical protein